MNNKVLAVGLLFILLVASYSNSFDAAFQFDDFHQLVDNPYVRKLSNIPKFFYRADMSYIEEGANLYRPVLHTSFTVNYAISGMNVWSYHLFNLTVHFLCCIFLFLIVGHVLKDTGHDSLGVPLVVSLVFAVQPLQTNSVTYISGRVSLLAGLFFLAGFYCFLRYKRGGAYVWAIAAPTLYFVGLLAKETVVTLPAMIILYELLMTRSGVRQKLLSRKFFYMSFIVLLAVFLVLKWEIQGSFNCNAHAYPEGVYPIPVYLMS